MGTLIDFLGKMGVTVDTDIEKVIPSKFFNIECPQFLKLSLPEVGAKILNGKMGAQVLQTLLNCNNPQETAELIHYLQKLNILEKLTSEQLTDLSKISGRNSWFLRGVLEHLVEKNLLNQSNFVFLLSKITKATSQDYLEHINQAIQQLIEDKSLNQGSFEKVLNDPSELVQKYKASEEEKEKQKEINLREKEKEAENEKKQAEEVVNRQADNLMKLLVENGVVSLETNNDRYKLIKEKIKFAIKDKAPTDVLVKKRVIVESGV